MQGLVGSATGWGPWAAGGMAAKDPALLQRLKRAGLEALAPQDGLRALHALLVAQRTARTAGMLPAANVVSPIHWSNLLKVPARAASAYYSEFQVCKSGNYLACTCSRGSDAESILYYAGGHCFRDDSQGWAAGGSTCCRLKCPAQRAAGSQAAGGHRAGRAGRQHPR